MGYKGVVLMEKSFDGILYHRALHGEEKIGWILKDGELPSHCIKYGKIAEIIRLCVEYLCHDYLESKPRAQP
jgi:hypothetical protein